MEIAKVLKSLDKSLSVIRTNPYLSGFITLFLVLYAGLAAPSLPANIAVLFEHNLTKIVFMSLMLILLRGQNTGMALLLAMGFIISMNTLSTHRTFNKVHDMAKSFADDLSTPDISKTRWTSDGSTHTVQLRGNVYEYKDVENLLPGGHGNMDDQELMGYENGALASW